MHSKSAASASLLRRSRAFVIAVLSVALLIPQAALPTIASAAAGDPISAKVVFQPGAAATSLIPAGYTRDSGDAYSAVTGSGWIRQDSLASATHVPFEVNRNTRARACTGTGYTLQNTGLIHMQAPGAADTGTLKVTPVAWEYTVPNGQYQVTVGIGEAMYGGDAEFHTIHVEGVTAFSRYPRAVTGVSANTCTTTGLKTNTVWATVTDGKLTIDAVGGTNTKLDYVTIDSVPVTGLTATPAATSIGLNWDDLTGATGYRVWRSTTLPVITTGTPLAAPSDSEFTDNTVTKGQVYYYAVAPSTGSTAAAVGALIDDPTPATPASWPVRVNFEGGPNASGGVKTGITTPTGWTSDTGQNFTNARGFGWVDDVGAPLDLTKNGRFRANESGVSPTLTSTMHMQGNTILNFATSSTAQQGTWQLSVPNGSYDVSVGVGDASPGSDPTSHTLNVEGQNLISNFAVTSATTGAARFKEATKTAIAVADGSLTVDAIGGMNTKIDYITVTPTPADQPPAKPAGLTATAGDGSVALSWTASADADLKGYNVYRGTTSTVATTSPLNSSMIAETATSFTDATAVNGTTYYYVLVAVDDADQSSVASDAASASPQPTDPALTPLPIKINFSTAAAVAVPGYTEDHGLPFTNAAGRGWVAPGTQTPRNLVDNSRFRDAFSGSTTVTAAQRGLIHMESSDITATFNGTKTSGSYEFAVADGYYDVTVSAGDQPGASGATCPAPCYDSVHTIVVEGTTAVDGFQATAAKEFDEKTVSKVHVTDGRLTIASGGAASTNTKINYVHIEASDLTAPAVPANVVATAGDGAVTLDWDAATAADLKGYNVYRSTDAEVATTPANLLTTDPIAATTLTDTALSNGTSYHYVVTSVDRSGNESAASEIVTAEPKDTTAPTKPTGLTAGAGDAKVTLRWAGNSELDLATYRVYRSTTSPVQIGTGTWIGATAAAEFVDQGTESEPLINGTTYYYAITAVDADHNESALSDEKSAEPTPTPDITAPLPPTELVATAGDGRVTLSWTASTDGDVASYEIYRSASSGAAGQLIQAVPSTDSAFIDTTTTNGNRYYYRVVAVDFAGNKSGYSNESDATPADTTAPAVPANVTATAGIQQITLSWTANAEPDLRGYRIYRFESPTAAIDEDHLVAVLIKPGRTFVDADLTAGTRYYYAVQSYDLVDNRSIASTVVSAVPQATPDTTAPSAPAGLTADVADGAVALSWTAVTATDLAGYTVYRSATAGGAKVKLTNTLIAGTSFTDTGAPAGSTSFYVVTASDTAGNESANSNQVSAALPSTGLDVKFTFQPTSAPAIAGYTKELGAAFDGTLGYGWVTQASLSSATHTPLDLSLNTRLRTRAAVTDLQNRAIHLQYGDIVPVPSTTTGSLTPGAWEYALPNGRYTVTASVGDQPGAAKTGCAAPCYDSLHTIRAEGVTLIDAFQATAAIEYKTGAATVDVTDGRLTVDAIGGSNTKMNWLTIVGAGPVLPDGTPPAAPSSLIALAGNASSTLTWAAPADNDVAGYNVYRSTGATVDPVAANKRNTSLLPTPSYSEAELTNGTTYRYVVTAVDTSGNESVASSSTDVTPDADASTSVNLKVNFQDAATTPPAGYLADFGQAFGARSSANQGTGNTYGWVRIGTSTPVSIDGNGRNRNTLTPPANQPDLRLATFIHMQLPANAASGVHENAAWELAVPNGAYTVTVAVGDTGTAVDSSNWINIENQNAIAAFVPTTTDKFATATRTVTVTDGRLTLSPASGTNTKIDYVDIASVDSAGRPYTRNVTPGNLATNVVDNSSIVADNSLNAVVGTVDETTLGGGNVTLTKVATGALVPGTGATSGGGDTVTFLPSDPLDGGVLYRFTITDKVKDKSGRAFLPFSSVFTTANGSGPGGGDLSGVAFDKTESGALAGKSYTSLVIGPDGKLYAGSIYGYIYRWTINADGTLADQETISTVRTHATAKSWEGAPNRTVIGLAFDPASTPDNPILWITDNYAYLGQNVPDFTGSIAKLTGPDLDTYQEVVVNLPRSIKDHETNSVAFKDGKLYIVQGSMNAMGRNDGTWQRDEHLMSAAMLQLDPAKLPANLPVDAATPDMTVPARGAVPGHVGTYNPYAADAPLTLYATGIRNAFDLLVHSNGRIYAGTNGSAAGGNTPASPNPLPAACAARPDGAYTAPTAPAITNNAQAETDYLFDVHQGKYYGHPNPMRCEYVLNAGNPTGYTGNPLFKVNAYPTGQLADPNYDIEHVHDAGLHASANGTIEYKNTIAFGGALAGKVIVVRYSANQEIVAFNVTSNGGVSDAVAGITGFTGFRQPLDIAQDVTSGNLYVSELTDNPATTGIKLLKPQGGGSAPKAEATSRLVFTEVQGGAASAAKSVSVKNIGGLPLTITGVTISGTDAALFSRTGTLPVTVAPGATVTLPVTFNPTAAGPRRASLVLSTNDPGAPTTTVALRGLGTLGTGGSNEPSLQWILDTLDIPVNVGDDNPANNAMPEGNALLGDEVEMPSFTKLLFDRKVGITPLSLFGPDGPAGNTNVAVVAAHKSSDATQRVVLFNGPNSSNQTVLPDVTTVGEWDLDDAFGFDVTWPGLTNRVTWSEDARNTWATNNHKIRVYPLKDSTGAVVTGSYIVAPEDVPTGVDYQDAAFVVSNVKAPQTAGAGKITPTPSELVFSGVKGTTSAAKQVTVTNAGITPLVISSVSVAGTNAGSFTVSGTPQTLAVGDAATFSATFKPGSSTVGAQSAVMRIVSDDATTPTLDVGLYGLATNGEQGDNEPPLKSVVDVLGYPINVGGTGLILGINPSPIGDEVGAPLFTRAGSAPVTMTPVARYSPDELLPFGWYEPNAGDPQTHEVATIALDNEQTLLPATVAGGGSSFDPGTASFGFYVDSKSFNRKSYTQDGLNTNIPHAVRTYPARNRSGAALPNTYLVAFEDAQNGDYQDYVFLVTGVAPVGGASTGTPVARIDFQPAASTVAAGYTPDTGAAYTAARGFGWVVPGSATPLDMTAQTRDRAGTVDAKLRTLILMQPTATQSPNGPGAWQYTVPNGTYQVTVGVGDSGFTDSTHRVQVEGQTAIAGFTPTTANAFSTATVTVQVTDGQLTVDATGGANTKLTYLDIDKPVTSADTTPPTVVVAVGGLQASAGVYKNKATVTVTASDAGSGVAGSSYSLDGGAFTPYTAPVEITTIGSHTVRARAQDAVGNIATSGTTTFSVVTAGASQAAITIENADGVPYSDRLVMNRIQNPERGTTCKDTAACDPVTGPFIAANVVHDTSSLIIHNTGTDPLNVTDLTVTGAFSLVNPPALPALVAVGGTLTVQVRFTATAIGGSGGLYTGSLTVGSDDPAHPTTSVELGGFWQSVSEGGQEPDVAELAKLFGYTTTVTAAGVALNQNGKVEASGDEILSPYWLRADPTQPVSVRQLSAFHTQGNTASFFWHAKGSTTTPTLFTHAGVEGQSILPHRNGSTTLPASGTFTPTAAFGLKIDGEWSDPTKNNQAADVANGCIGACGHHVRAWAVRDRTGAIVPNTWLVGMDYSGINYDYNDNLFLISNMKPETAADPAAPALLPGAAGLQLGFGTAVAGTLADAAGQGTGFVGTQPNKLDLTVGSDSYKPALLHLATGTPGTLTVDSSANGPVATPNLNGTNGSNDNTLANGLQLPFDGHGGTFTVSGRTLGAVDELNAGSEQRGIMLGADQDNFVKVAAINKAGVPSIEFYAETAGTGATVGTTVAIPNPASVTTVDLALIGDPSAGTVKAGYRLNGGAWVVLPTTWTAPAAALGKFFGQRTYGGILVSHKGGAAFAAVYDSFGIADGDTTTTAAPRNALYRIDVAGSADYTDTAGRVWTPDTGRFSPSTAVSEGATTTPLEIAGTDDDVLYRTYRGNVGSLTPRTISFALPAKGAAKVDLRLHFAERAAGNNAVGKRVFSIDVEGATVRPSFDIFAAAGGQNTATVLPVNNVTVANGMINLALTASVDYPSIAAIEVLCQGTCPDADTTAPDAPTGLTAVAGATGITLDWADSPAADLMGYNVYRSSTEGGTFTKVNTAVLTASTFVDTAAVAAGSQVYYQVRAIDSSENLSAASATVSVTAPLPPVVRINAGGPAQTVSGTIWSACAATTTCSNWVTGGNAYSETDTITGIPAGMNNTIFQSEWTGGGTTAVGAKIFGFTVPVANGSYRVRLHFAELNKTAAGTRLFDVRLENTTVLSNFDIWAQAGGIDKAIVREYPATITDGAVNIDFMKRVENAKISAIEIIPVTAPDTTAPAVVTGLTATPSASGVALAWSASTAADLAGYNVYRSATAGGTYTKLNGSTLLGAVSFNDTAAPQGAASYYQVTAVDSSGNESVRSATANATRPDTTAPGVVTGLTAASAATGIALAWSASAATDLAGYTVYRSATVGGTYAKVNAQPLTGTSYTDTTVAAGETRYYRVTAVDTAGNESATSATVNATRADTTAPAVVTGVSATPVAGGIAVAWSASAATDLAGYTVYRSTSEAGTYTKVTSALVTGMSYVDTTAPQGAVSYYKVTAVDLSGNESDRSAPVNATRADTTAPAVVTGPAATPATTGITVSWSASSATDLAGYNVYRSASATGTFAKVNTALLQGVSYLDTGVAVGATGYYYVTAVDLSANESTKSATVNATRPTTTRPTVRINTGGAAQTVAGTTWSACSSLTACSAWVTGGNPYSENDTITGIPTNMNLTIARSEWTGGGTTAVGARAFGFSVPVANGGYRVRLHFVELNKTAANTRRFDVRLENATVLSNFDIWATAGGIDRAIVREFPVTVTDGAVSIDFMKRIENAKITAIEIIPVDAPDTAAPGQLTGVTATGSTTGIALAWGGSAVADIAGYNVYRATSAAGSYAKLTATPVTTTSFTDTTAPVGAVSYYQVTAVDTSGNESVRSATVNAARTRPTIRINTGGAAQTVAGTAWSACSSLTACSSWVTGGNPYSENDTITGIPTYMNLTIARSEWTGGGTTAVGARAFGFSVPVANGSYRVRLHFVELNKTAANTRRFDVRLENATVLSNFDIWATAGGIDRAIVREFPVTVTDGAVSIDFMKRIENAKISAIEIIPN